MTKEDIFFLFWMLGCVVIVWRFEAMNRRGKTKDKKDGDKNPPDP
jgi:hypothetical protein